MTLQPNALTQTVQPLILVKIVLLTIIPKQTATITYPSREDNLLMRLLERIVEELADHPKLGILRLDQEYFPSKGDVNHKGTFSYPVIYRVVPGLTLQTARSGHMTEELATEFDEAVLWLANEQKVSAITGDSGYMLWFQERARRLTRIPVFLTVMHQIPSIHAALCMQNEPILVLTSRAVNIRPMEKLIHNATGELEESQDFIFVDCDSSIECPATMNLDRTEGPILTKAFAALDQYPKARAFLLESTTLTPFSDAIRAATGLPVYDTITSCNFTMEPLLVNTQRGHVDSWYQSWDGKQESYYLGKNLTNFQRKKLRSQLLPQCVQDMIAAEVENSEICTKINWATKLSIDSERVVQAIAQQIQLAQYEKEVRNTDYEIIENTQEKFREHVAHLYRRLVRREKTWPLNL